MRERLKVVIALVIACALLAAGAAVSDQVGVDASGPPTGTHAAAPRG